MTALFCDVTGSTALGEELDPEVFRVVMNRYLADISATIERHGGAVDAFHGDAVMAVFGIPRVHKDDALRAVRAAAEIRERLPIVADQTGVPLRFSAAWATLVRCDAILAGFGEQSFRSTVQAFLSEVHELLGDRAAAEQAIDLSEKLSAVEDVVNPIVTHRVRARLALGEGDLQGAERWARAAVAEAFRTEFVVQQGTARLQLAHVLSALGRREEATSEARSALERFESKGDRPGAERAVALLDELSTGG